MGEPPAPPPAAPPPRPKPRFDPASIDWERWIGVQGAAVVGGVVLALAGLLFFRYSIEHGLISPALRVALGAVVGLLCIAAPNERWRSRYTDAANALAGAGIAILYGCVWAAHVRYDLIGFVPAFLLMTAVTGVACFVSVRHDSLVVALLGLAGGFATPFLLAAGAERPIALFGYLLVLDTALLAIAQRRGWPLLALASLLGTALHQAWWLGFHTTPASPLALVILGLFALLFVFATSSRDVEDTDAWGITRAGSVLVPFGFGIFLASDVRLSPSLPSLAALLALLSAAAAWIGRAQRRPWLPLAAAAGDVAALAVWVFTRPLATHSAWELTLVAVALALVFHLFLEWAHREGTEGMAHAAGMAACGLSGVLVLAALRYESGTLWPWLFGWLALAALLQRNEALSGTPHLAAIAACEIALGLFLVDSTHPSFPDPSIYLVVLVGVAGGFQIATMLRAASPARRGSERAAALIALLLLGVLLLNVSLFDSSARSLRATLPFLGSTLLLGVLAAIAATRMASGSWYLAAVVTTALLHGVWILVASGDRSNLGTALALQAASVVVFTGWPLLTRRFHDVVPAWWAAALAGPFWFLQLRELYTQRFGDAWIGVLPLALGLVALGAAWRARGLWPAEDPMRKSALAWLGAVALGFLTVTIPLQLDHEWLAIGWALEAFAVAALWRRLDHPGLKYFALALVAVVTARLATHDALHAAYPLPSPRIVNWLLYTYLVPAAAFLGVATRLAPLEVGRLTPRERESLYPRNLPIGAAGAGLAAIVVTFLWINLAIAEWYTVGPELRLAAERLPARDLTTSIAWALYALALLAVGVARGIKGLRGLSLAFLLLAIGKVFLHDLGALRDLYRVVSLVGLAASLILVSLAYQRFVFGVKSRAEMPPPSSDG